MISIDSDKPKLIVICGPTGVGKTSLAIQIAEKVNGEIIGADSMQIYRHMDIGTAKPTQYERTLARHHMVDIIEPDEPFDAAAYARMANEIILNLQQKSVMPLVVGGTGLYIKALIYGLSRAAPADKDVIKRLKKEAEEHGREYMHRKLEKIDKKAAARIHPNDVFRIVRALEIYEKTGKPISLYNKEHGFRDQRFNTLKICLYNDRELLYDRINQRVDMMIKEGFIDEVKGLLERGHSRDLKSMQSIGYRHMTDHILDNVPWEETVATMKMDTRRYAKRQLTWFRKDPNIIWIEKGKIEDVIQTVNRFLGYD